MLKFCSAYRFLDGKGSSYVPAVAGRTKHVRVEAASFGGEESCELASYSS